MTFNVKTKKLNKIYLVLLCFIIFLLKPVYAFVGSSREECEKAYGKPRHESEIKGETVVIYTPKEATYGNAVIIVSYTNNVSTSTQYKIKDENKFPDSIFRIILKINAKPNLNFNRCGFSPDKTKEIWSLEDSSVFITKNIAGATVDVVARDRIIKYSEDIGVKTTLPDKPQGIAVIDIQRSMAEKGDAYSQYMLGLTYAQGNGVEKDQSEAVKWYRKAAEQGLAEAQSLLGSCYELGKGVEKNQFEAVKWYRKAAEQGVALAQYFLGFCYESGNGIEKNQAEAVRLYHKAAEQGSAQAQFCLGSCYVDGKGVARDRVEGCAYWNLASSRLEIARKFLSELEVRLSPDEIAASQQRTKELQKNIARINP